MTPEEISQKQIEIYRRMTPQQRLRAGFEANKLARELVRWAFRSWHPDWDERQVEEAVRRWYRRSAGIPEDLATLQRRDADILSADPCVTVAEPPRSD